jgi:hypothetical protein
MRERALDLTSRLHSSLLWAALFIVPLGLAASGCTRTTVVDCEQGAEGANACVCEYNGKSYPAGAGFKDADGCNDCGCNEDGSVACTLKLCVPDGQVCGGLMDSGCPAGEFCNYPIGALCGAADAPGFCEKPAEACAEIYQPVCGCDDKTYGNSCEASSAKVSVVHDGECGTGCDYNGQHYQPDDSFPSEDGCNDCFCGENGSVGCTKRACLPKD